MSQLTRGKSRRLMYIEAKEGDIETGDQYWVSGVKQRGSNAHWAEPVTIVVDDDAEEEYERIKSGR